MESTELTDLVSSVTCPTCHVTAGIRCTTRAGKPAREQHGRRFDALDQAAGIAEHRAAARREAEARGGWLVTFDRAAEAALLTAYAARIAKSVDTPPVAAQAAPVTGRTVTIPGALADHLATLTTDTETDTALAAGRRGRGRTLVIPATIPVLHSISRIAETLLDTKGTSRAQRAAARLWITRAGHAPAVMVHQFDSTDEAYDATQCRDDIRDGDVLVIEPEGVVGFLRRAWPVAITAEHGDLHTVEDDTRTLDGGRYADSAIRAERIATEHGFALAHQGNTTEPEQTAPAAVEPAGEQPAPAAPFRPRDRVVCADGKVRTVASMMHRTGEPARVVVEEGGAQWVASECSRLPA
ncbi:hypothetical protein ACFQ61_02065 [Streptomyces sp. NPDC056500]|uniref:zinc finger domain-containing protein n=1 Tax=Streptomyces sp. NPDC056500 TaxID=3345840 RepID=UPI003695763E